SLTVDSRTATSEVAVPPPAGTYLDEMVMGYQRRDAGGQGALEWLAVGVPGDRLFIAPTSPVTAGTLYYFTEWWFTGNSTAYTAIYPSDGQIPADQTRPIDPADM